MLGLRNDGFLLRQTRLRPNNQKDTAQTMIELSALGAQVRRCWPGLPSADTRRHQAAQPGTAIFCDRAWHWTEWAHLVLDADPIRPGSLHIVLLGGSHRSNNRRSSLSKRSSAAFSPNTPVPDAQMMSSRLRGPTSTLFMFALWWSSALPLSCGCMFPGSEAPVHASLTYVTLGHSAS